MKFLSPAFFVDDQTKALKFYTDVLGSFKKTIYQLATTGG